MRYWLLFISTAVIAGTTPNMGLVKPDAGDTNYRQKIDTILNQIDAHSHISGQGVLVPSSGIANGAITTSKIADRSVTSAKIALGGVSTSQLADNSVTLAKRAVMNSSSQYASLGGLAIAPVSTLTVSTGTYVLVTNQQIGLQSSGRPVMLGIKPTNGTACFLSAQATTACDFQWTANGTAVGADSAAGTVPCSAVSTVVPMSAGSNIYTLSIRNSSGAFACAAVSVSIFGYEL